MNNHQKGTQVNHTTRSARTPSLRTGVFGVESGGSDGVGIGEGTASLRQTAAAQSAGAAIPADPPPAFAVPTSTTRRMSAAPAPTATPKENR